MAILAYEFESTSIVSFVDNNGGDMPPSTSYKLVVAVTLFPVTVLGVVLFDGCGRFCADFKVLAVDAGTVVDGSECVVPFDVVVLVADGHEALNRAFSSFNFVIC